MLRAVPARLLCTVGALGALAIMEATAGPRQTDAGQARSITPSIYRTLPVEIVVRERPTAVELSDGKWHVAYGLFITSWMTRDLELRSLEVRDTLRHTVVARFDTTALADPFRQRTTYLVESVQSSRRNLVIAPGRTSFVSVEYVVASPAALPRAIEHLVRFAPDSLLAMRLDDGTVTSALSAISAPRRTSREIRLISAPLPGGPWRCANGLAYGNAHSSVYPYRTAIMRVPQRFGCDFFKVDSAGNTLPNPFPDTINNGMFYGYGAPVLAVADGIITHVTDGVPENVPQANGTTRTPSPLTNRTISGNWISLRIADSAYAFYAHLQPGSIRVREGQRVKRGDVIARLGNAGNSVGPHLHFHLGNANSLNESDAVAHEYARFALMQREKGVLSGAGVAKRRQLPADGAIVRFPDPPGHR